MTKKNLKISKVAGGGNQVNVGLSDEQYELLQRYTQIKGLRTVQDSLRYMVDGCRGFVEAQLKTSSPAAPIGIAAPAAAKTSPPDRNAVTGRSATPAEEADTSAEAVSDDGMAMPKVVIAGPSTGTSPAAGGAAVDEEEELSTSDQIRRNRAQPAREVETPRWASLKDDV